MNDESAALEIRTRLKVPRKNEEITLVNPQGLFGKSTWMQTLVSDIDESKKSFTTEKSVYTEDGNKINSFLFEDYGITWFDGKQKLPHMGEHLKTYKWRTYEQKS